MQTKQLWIACWASCRVQVIQRCQDFALALQAPKVAYRNLQTIFSQLIVVIQWVKLQ